ncbi:MAG: hypothetical protein JSU71_05160 [Betaproteobacteria bacterium]|nr:MAG: hypothetical protein JSU71_05160 [Betaproteobacteria bacterium]
MRPTLISKYGWQQIGSWFTPVVILAFIAFLFAGCGGGGSTPVADDGTTPTPLPATVEAPGVPTGFAVAATPNVDNSATLTWSPPTTGGDPATYELYHSTTAGQTFPDNHVQTIDVVAGQAIYQFVHNALEPVENYWVVSAKNAVGETAAAEVMYKPLDPTVEAPGVPTNFTVAKTAGEEVILSATLTWSPPTSGGPAETFEIYRSLTAGEAFLPGNHLISIPVVAGQASYEFIDNAGLTPRVDIYWVVSAKNAGGETPTAEKTLYLQAGPPGGTGETGFGNNFAAAMIFADDIGLGGAPITGTRTTDLAAIDFNTGLRPSSGEAAALLSLPVPVTQLPYFDPGTAYDLGGTPYYEQQTANTWQGWWEKGAGTLQEVTAKWGDNLISQRLTGTSVVRIEMVLTKPLTAAVKSYNMQSLYGTMRNEIYGTDGTEYDNLTAFVFAANAHLKIEKLDASGNPAGHTAFDGGLWQGDGPGFLGAEINVGGNLTYGFVWMLKNEAMPAGIPKEGQWRLTFSLDPQSPHGDNTNIIAAANGTLVNENEVYIDITIQ